MGAFVSALITLVHYDDYREIYDSIPPLIINPVRHFFNPDDLFLRTEAMSWLAIVIAGIAVLIGIVALVGRICDCTEKNSANRRICTSLVSNYDC